MSESPNPGIDPDSARPMGETDRLVRRKVGPAKILLAFVLAVAITAAAFSILAVVLWAIASFFH
jgi:hypothetical protein